MFLIASRFPTPLLACAFFSPGATVTMFSFTRKFEEDLVSYLKYFHDTSESSDDSTNVNQTIDELPQALPIFHPTFHSEAESPFTLDSTPTYVDESPNVFNPPPQHPMVTVKTLISRSIFTIFNNSISVVISVGARTKLFNVNKLTFMSLVVNIAEAHMRIFSVNRILVVKIARDLMKPFSVNQRMKIIAMSKILAAILILLVMTIIPACCDDDDDYDFAIIPVLSTEEPIDSLSMGDEHLNTIPTTESDKVIKSSVEDLVPILSEFKGIPDTMCDVHLDNNHTPLEAKDHVEIVINSNDDISSSDGDSLHEENIEYVESSVEDLVPIPNESEGIPEHMCDVPFHDNSPPLDVLKDQFEDFSESNDEFSSTDNDSFSIDNIDYVEASPPDFELVSSEVMKIVIPEVGRIDDDILLTIKDDILCEKLLNANLLITKIEAFNDNPTPSFDCKTKDLPDPGELMSVLNSGIHENPPSTTRVNLPVEDDYSLLLAYVVWIFLAYLTYPVIPPYLHSCGNEDTIFNPGITINRFFV
nr:hypothetical protein [Tanacetum cinerariifolium]